MASIQTKYYATSAVVNNSQCNRKIIATFMYSIQLLELSKRLINEVLHITGPIMPPHAHTYTHTASGKFHIGTENVAALGGQVCR